MLFTVSRSSPRGFTLIEVVLALGVFFISILALIGLLGPMLQSVDEIEKIDEITSVVNTTRAFLLGSPDIGDLDATPPVTKFNAIYRAVASDNSATLFVFRRYIGSSTDVELVVGFQSGEFVAPDLSPDAELLPEDFENAAGPIYRVVLSASPVNSEDFLTSTTRDSDTGIFTLETEDPVKYLEGYLAMEARVFAESPRENFDPSLFANGESVTLETLKDIEADFVFNCAIVR